ncbi:MAG: xylulokinase, partial [Micrococcales bacterium]
MLVAGVDSSTQSCKVLIRELETGKIVRQGSAKHPDGSEVNPEHWWNALQEAIQKAGGIDDVAAVSIAGQQHGMVALDEHGTVIRDALLWNDTRSAQAAKDLTAEVGAENFAKRTGLVPVASFTITKLRWLKDNEPANAANVHAVALPHDWLTWRLMGFGPDNPNFDQLATDRSEAAGTGYFNPQTNEYDRDLLKLALGKDALLPKVFGPGEAVGKTAAGAIVAPGGGDNAMAALGLGAREGDAVISIGTSGTVFSVSATPVQDSSGTIAGFADASGNYLPITVTLNAARLLASISKLLNVDFDELATLALAAPAGSTGLTTVPFFEGERTPNLPNATGSLHGLTLESFTRENLARSVIEGMLSGLAYGLKALKKQGVPVSRVMLIGGAAQNLAVQQIAATLFDGVIEVPAISEYVAEGATVQAAWALTGSRPNWHPETLVSLDGKANQ